MMEIERFTKKNSTAVRVSVRTRKKAQRLAGYISMKTGESASIGHAIGIAVEAEMKKRGLC